MLGLGLALPRASVMTPGGPTLSLTFAGATTLDPAVTFTRALNTATYFDNTGTLQTATANTPRFDYDPSTLAARGLLIEEARTNSIRNNTMQGAVAGTPGTLPTNWATVGAGIGTLTQQIVGIGTNAGINYIDIKISGTTSTTSFGISFESTTQIVAASGQTWTSSLWVAIVGGTTSNLSINCRVVERDSLGTALANTALNITTSINSTLTRSSVVSTLANASTARTTSDILLGFSSGVAIDITLRIGLPQLEQGAFATSVIPTTAAAATRNADVASVNTLTPWYNATEGTLYGEITDAAITVSGVSRRIANINDGTESDRITIGYAGATSVAAAFVTDNGVAQAAFNSPSGAYPFPTKVALAYAANDFQAAVNGSAFAADTSGTLPTVDRMTLGDVVTGGTGPQNLNGHIRRIAYYPRKLSSAELQAITG